MTASLIHLVRQFRHIGKPRKTGSWIFRQKRLSWMYRPELRRQMPALYQAFSWFCQVQRSNDELCKARYADTMFKIVSKVTSLLSLPDYICLELDRKQVFLDLLDPRFIQVVNEIQDKRLKVLLEKYLSPGDTFIDIGSNHGSYSLIAGHIVGPSGMVVAVEPQLRLAMLIEQSLAANVPCSYQVHQIACGSHNDWIPLFIPQKSSGSASVFAEYSARADHRKFDVPIRRFDDAVDWKSLPGNIFLKVDIEGSEFDFLKGAQAMLMSRSPFVLFEINPKALTIAGVKIGELIRFLNYLGYTSYVEFFDPVTQFPLDNLDLSRERNIIINPGGKF